jgi:peptidoglycan-N-acetylmuramic acid deacetylase
MFPIFKQTIIKKGGTSMKRIIWIIGMLLILAPSITYGSVSNQQIHWGIKKAENENQAEAGAKLDQIIEKYGAFYKGDPISKNIYLTFDSGYENGNTPKILDVLKKEKVPATFFVTGHFLESQKKLSKRIVKEGHIIGNHSWSHPDFTAVSAAKIQEELEKVKARTKEITGQKEMKYLRPPRGIFSERTLQITKDEGYTHVFWSLAYVDWNVKQQKGAEYAYNNIMRQIHPGAVLLLHTISKDNADALEKVIKDLKNRGYHFKSLDDFPMKK